MSSTLPSVQDVARQLLAGELARAGSPHDDVGQAVQAIERLRVALTRLAGAAGFSSLLSRALTMAKRRVPSLEGLRVGADGSLEGFEEIHQDADAAESTPHGGVVLLSELLGLLVTLVGEPLTLTLVRDVWPDVPMEALTPDPEERP